MTYPIAPVITVTPTVMDGTVVRWYVNTAAAETGVEVMSASREGVLINVHLHKIPDEWLLTATQVYERLRTDRSADFAHLATHRKTRMFGPVELIDAG